MLFQLSVWPSGDIGKSLKLYTINWIRYSKWFLGGALIIAAVLVLTVAFALYISPKEEVPKGAIHYIKERGHLTVLLEPNSLNYHIYKGDARGFGLEMMRSFSKYLDIPLKVIACSSVSKALYYLDYHVADIMAYNLPVTRAGMNLVHYSSPLKETNLVLVQRSKSVSLKDTTIKFIQHLDELEDDTVVVQQSAFSQPLYDQFVEEAGGDVILRNEALTQEELFRMVSEGAINYTLCPNNMAMVLNQAYRNTDISQVVSKPYSIAWGVNYTSDSLLMILNYWIDSVASRRLLRKAYRNIYHNPRVVNHFRSDYFSIVNNRISPWDEQIRYHSKLFWWDWRLVTSLMYTESNFVPGLTSNKNAWGLMQMIPETAAIYGLDTSSTSSHQIMAGVKYLKWIDKQLPSEIRDPRERASFTLAAYNVGIGSVLSLRKKAEKFGKDPNRWHGHVEYYLLQRSHRDPYGYADTLRQFPKDYTMDGYVDGIINRYYHYLNLVPD